jgi:hypothetical protein
MREEGSVILGINIFYHEAAAPEIKMGTQIDRRSTSRQAARPRPENPVV